MRRATIAIIILVACLAILMPKHAEALQANNVYSLPCITDIEQVGAKTFAVEVHIAGLAKVSVKQAGKAVKLHLVDGYTYWFKAKKNRRYTIANGSKAIEMRVIRC